MNEELKKALDILRKGGLILYPTDTIWGIGCDATDPEAVSRIYALKQREDSKSMIMLVGSESQLERYVDDIPEIAFDLIDAATEPLTIVYSHPSGIADNLKAADGSAAIRLTRDQFCSKLCMMLGRPLVSTSANISGQPAPGSFSEIDPAIIEGVDYAVDLRRGEQTGNRPSAIIKLGDGGVISVIRHG